MHSKIQTPISLKQVSYSQIPIKLFLCYNFLKLNLGIIMRTLNIKIKEPVQKKNLDNIKKELKNAIKDIEKGHSNIIRVIEKGHSNIIRVIE
jgi:hypothetical protein